MSIEQDIAGWDGQSAGDIGAIYQHYCSDISLLVSLIKCMQQAPLQNGASWLLKKHLESGADLAPSEASAIYALLPTLEHWGAKLHILQSLPFMPIAKKDKKRVAAFLATCLVDNNKFVKAWAYNGFYELSVRHPEYEKQAKQFFKMGLKDEPASVKARIRNIMKKKGFEHQ